MSKYKFNPAQYGFEPVDEFPELSYQYPMNTGSWFIKISEYSDYGALVYWYHAIFTGVGIDSDDRIKIMNCSHDSRKTIKCKEGITKVINGKLSIVDESDLQNSPSTEFCGLISTHKFAVQLLKHLLGTTKNESVKNEGKERLFSCKGKLMRSEFNYS